jgi:uncharacterized protein YciI
MHYLLRYKTAPDYLERRTRFREEHLRVARLAAERDGLLFGGAVGEPIDGALLLWEGDSPDAAIAFARADPYVINGVVESWEVTVWHTVVGRGMPSA